VALSTTSALSTTTEADHRGAAPVKNTGVPLSGQRIELCYHCHKCASGCPIINEMQYGPDRVLRMMALGQETLLLASRDIWLCTGCFNCITHCPNNINIAEVMDHLRQQAIFRGIKPAERDVLLFHRLFVGVVKQFGRSHEAFMLGLFKVLSRVPFPQDLKSGLQLFLKGKVPLIPPRTRARQAVQQLFRRSEDTKDAK
jgi:heterodisulfide reductase subunit C